MGSLGIEGARHSSSRIRNSPNWFSDTLGGAPYLYVKKREKYTKIKSLMHTLEEIQN